MKFLSDLINRIELDEGVQAPINRPKTGKRGFIAVLDRNGKLDYESAYAFENPADANRMEKFLEQSLEDSQVVVDECADGTFIVISARAAVNTSEAEFLAFASTEDDAREKVQDLINDQTLYNFTEEDMHDLDFIATQD